MIKKIDSDEWYPVYFFSKNFGTEVDIPEDKLAWIDTTFSEFQKVQDYLKELCKEPITEEERLAIEEKKAAEAREIAAQKAAREELHREEMTNVKLVNQRALDAAWERHLKKKGKA